MSLALTTLVIFVLLMPGIVFRAFLIKSEALENPLDTSFQTELVLILLFGIPLQLLGYLFIRMFGFSFDFGEFYELLAGSPTFDKMQFTHSWLPFLVYHILMILAGIMLGWSVRKLILRYYLDLRFKSLPISNEWDNILSGRLALFNQMESQRNECKGLFTPKWYHSKKRKLELTEKQNSILELIDLYTNDKPTFNPILIESIILSYLYPNDWGDLVNMHKLIRDIYADLDEIDSDLSQLDNQLDKLLQENGDNKTIDRVQRMRKALKTTRMELKESLDKQLSEALTLTRANDAVLRSNNKSAKIKFINKTYQDRRKRLTKVIRETRRIKFAFIYVEVIVEINDSTILYKGNLTKYYLAKNNLLSKIVLNSARREQIGSKDGKKKRSQSTFKADNSLVIPFNQIKNLTVTPKLFTH